jgi:hypothetical protein
MDARPGMITLANLPETGPVTREVWAVEAGAFGKLSLGEPALRWVLRVRLVCRPGTACHPHYLNAMSPFADTVSLPGFTGSVPLCAAGTPATRASPSASAAVDAPFRSRSVLQRGYEVVSGSGA